MARWRTPSSHSRQGPSDWASIAANAWASTSTSGSKPSIAAFGTAAAGGVFVPLNPLLKPDQVAYILRDCNVRVLVTSPERLAALAGVLRRVSGPAARRS